MTIRAHAGLIRVQRLLRGRSGLLGINDTPLARRLYPGSHKCVVVAGLKLVVVVEDGAKDFLEGLFMFGAVLVDWRTVSTLLEPLNRDIELI